jgi:hypothetical protein
LVFEIARIENIRILKSKINKLLEIPFSNWLTKIEEIINNPPVIPTTDKPVSFWIEKLSKQFGTIAIDKWRNCI